MMPSRPAGACRLAACLNPPSLRIAPTRLVLGRSHGPDSGAQDTPLVAASLLHGYTVPHAIDMSGHFGMAAARSARCNGTR